MLKLTNISTYDFDLDKFNHSKEEIEDFLEKNKMDGLELFNVSDLDESIIPRKIVKGVHLIHHPTWLDFWHNNKEALLEQFGSMDNVKDCYGGIDRKVIVEQFRKEIEAVNKVGAEYMVFHVSHVELEHIYNYNFTYNDSEVVDATIELVNEIFKGVKSDVKLLFENLWWPGLTMLDKNLASKLLEEVNYQNVGFMLDTGHLMNTNVNLKNEEQAIEYVLNTINELGELKKFIKGIHLSCSVSGEYVKEQIPKNRLKKFTLEEMYNIMNNHIINVDRHRPFTSNNVRKIINTIAPEYLIYEFIDSSLEEIQENIEIQNRACMLD